MVELQANATAFAEAGVALYALSYDEVDALADYARVHGVTFPLLSDPDSAIIERLGILNTLIDPDDHPWYGIPFPGSYVLDGDGTVVAKFFEESLHFRASADQLLRSALGHDVELPALPPEVDRTDVTVDVTFDGEVLQATVIRDLIVRFTIPEGRHIYGQPVPEGMVATSVEIDPMPGLVVRDPVFPPTTAHTLAGTGEVLRVYTGRSDDGAVLVRIPISQQSRPLVTAADGTRVLPIEGTIRWQSCDDQTCQLPRTERFAISIPAEAHNRPEGERDNPDGMDVRAHLIQMMARRTDRSIADAFEAMTGDD